MTAKNMSITALVCGIVGIVGSFIPYVGYVAPLAAIAGIVFGALALNRIKQGRGYRFQDAGYGRLHTRYSFHRFQRSYGCVRALCGLRGYGYRGERHVRSIT